MTGIRLMQYDMPQSGRESMPFSDHIHNNVGSGQPESSGAGYPVSIISLHTWSWQIYSASQLSES